MVTLEILIMFIIVFWTPAGTQRWKNVKNNKSDIVSTSLTFQHWNNIVWLLSLLFKNTGLNLKQMILLIIRYWDSQIFKILPCQIMLIWRGKTHEWQCNVLVQDLSLNLRLFHQHFASLPYNMAIGISQKGKQPS